MSRTAQSKSRADKKGSQSAPTPAITQEIVPGKFNDQDWSRMIEADDGEDFCSELIEELVSDSIGIIFEKYLDRQLIPYTVSQAKDAILTIIEWQFLARDEGEGDPMLCEGWQGEDEPETSVLDCWAQGSVPRAYVPSSPIILQDESASEVGELRAVDEEPEPLKATADKAEADETVEDMQEEEEEVEPDPPVIPEIPEPELYVKKEVNTTPHKVIPLERNVTIASSDTIPIEKPKSKGKYKRHTGKLRPPQFDLTETLEDTQRQLETAEAPKTAQPPPAAAVYNPMPQSVSSILKLQLGRPPGNRDVYYNEDGDVVAMARINPEKLPSHRIKTKCHIVDPQAEAAQARLEAMRTGRYVAKAGGAAGGGKKPMPPSVPPSDQQGSRTMSSNTYRRGTMNASQTSSVRNLKRGMREGKVTPLPPPLIESMEVAPGVVVTEGQRTKRGPRQIPRGIDRLPSDANLLAVGPQAPLKISVHKVLYGQSPTIRMRESPPVPPIMPHPPSGPRVKT